MGQLHTFTVGFEDVLVDEGTEAAYEADGTDSVDSDFKVEVESGHEFEYSFPHPHKVVERLPEAVEYSFREVVERLPEAVNCMAAPMVAQDCVAFFLLAERLAKTCKIVLSGQGADEVFGGNVWSPHMEQAVGTPLYRFRSHYSDHDHAEYLATVQPA